MLEERIKKLGMSMGPGQIVDLPGATVVPTEALRQADLFVLPSREEGMSIASFLRLWHLVYPWLLHRSPVTGKLLVTSSMDGYPLRTILSRWLA